MQQIQEPYLGTMEHMKNANIKSAQTYEHSCNIQFQFCYLYLEHFILHFGTEAQSKDNIRSVGQLKNLLFLNLPPFVVDSLGKGEKAGNLKQVSLSTNMRSSYIFFILIPKWILKIARGYPCKFVYDHYNYLFIQFCK